MRKKFVIPLQSAVEQYIAEKKPKWPPAFVTYYAERFWNHYQASGWKLSNGNAVKDWKACFCSNWQTLKFKEDIDRFNFETQRLIIESKTRTAQSVSTPQTILDQSSPSNYERTLDYLDDLMSAFAKKREDIEDETLAACYDFLKRTRIMSFMLTPTQKDFIKGAYSNNIPKGKAVCVATTLEQMINYGFSFRKKFGGGITTIDREKIQ